MRIGKVIGINLKSGRIDRKAKFTLAIVCMLAFSQWMTFAHGAAYGFGKHDHNGVTCAIPLYGSAQDAILGTSGGLEESLIFENFGEIKHKVINCDQRIDTRSIRAPPISMH